MSRAGHRLVLGLVLVAGLLLSGVASAAPGDFDPTFGGGTGVTQVNVTEQYGSLIVEQVLQRPNGSVVIIGTDRRDSRVKATQRTATGEVDESFGDGGHVTLDGLDGDGFMDVLAGLDAAGRVIVGGQRLADDGGGAAVLRLTDAGALDQTFGLDGLLPLGESTSLQGLAVRPEGQFYVLERPSESASLLSRYDATGALDPEFSDDGILALPSGGSQLVGLGDGAVLMSDGIQVISDDGSLGPSWEPEVFAAKIAVDASSRVIAAGLPIDEENFSVDDGSIEVRRWSAAGVPDPTFGSSGVAVHNLFPGEPVAGRNVTVSGVIETSDAGLVVTAPTPGAGAPRSILLAKLDGAGALDAAFGTDGVTSTGSTNVFPISTAALDGGVLVPHQEPNPFICCPGDMERILRLTAAGEPDPTFGEAGVVRRIGPLYPTEDIVELIGTQSDGAPVVAATVEGPEVLRLTEAGDLDTSFGVEGRARLSELGAGMDARIPYWVAMVIDELDRPVLAMSDLVGGDFVLRLTPDGELDMTFGDGEGYVEVESSYIRSLAASDGGISVLATTHDGDLFVRRLTSDGSTDTGFGTSGDAPIGPAGGWGGWGVIEHLGDEVLVAWNEWDVSVARLDPDGSLDASWGTGGVATIEADEGDSLTVTDLLVESTGDVSVVGQVCVQPDPFPCVDDLTYIARVGVDGDPDATFGTNGMSAVAVAGDFMAAPAAALLGDGSYVVAVEPGWEDPAVLLRFGNDGEWLQEWGDEGVFQLPQIEGQNDLAIDDFGNFYVGGSIVDSESTTPSKDLVLAKLRGVEAGTDPPFADVPQGHQFFDAIQWMFDSGTSTGSVNPDGGKPLYKPTDVVRRQAMGAFLYRLAGSPAVSGTPHFADVPVGHQFFDALQWMFEAGVSTGSVNPDGGLPLFKPGDVVRRQAMGAFLYRLEGSPDVSGTPHFADVPVGHQFFDALQWMFESGTSTGSVNPAGGDPLFKPSGDVLRQAMAAFLYRIHG